MATSTCSNTTNCGCTTTYTVVPPCPPACSEVFNASCVVYTGVDITCGTDTVISRNDYLDTVVTKLTNYICTKLIALDNYGIFTITDTDSGYTWSNIGSAAAVTPADTFTYVSGESINLDVDSTLLAMRVSFGGFAAGATGAGLSGAGTVASPLVNSALKWFRFNSDSGFTEASTTADILTVAGGDGIGTAISGDTLTITNNAAKWTKFISDGGTSTTAGVVNDELTVSGGTGITTSIAGDILTITNDSPGTAVALTSAGGTETLVSDGTGPALSNKGLTAGTGISLSSDAVSVTVANSGVTEAVAGEGIGVSAGAGAVTFSNTGSLLTVVDITIAGGAVTTPAAGAVNVSGTGISSTYMTTQLFSSAGALIAFDTSQYTITGMGVSAGQFTMTNVALANGSYKLVVVGNLA